ncbi:dienelactone hydrolase family protein [Patescibacteria group bacterium]|jgi:carboxymethylenebutenolidase|nr:dienelactone hydrolase family protein [Patescibacteria group bacterium]
MKKILLAVSALALMAAGCPTAPTVSTPETPKGMSAVIEQNVDQNGLKGTFFVPSKREGKLPALLVMHEWWGLNDYIKNEARNLADEGYAVFAISLYDGEVATTSSRAGELAGQVRANPAEAERQMKLALNFLERQPEVDASRMASMGWCFGGGMSNILVSSGDKRVKASVVYYGTPITDPAHLKNMSQPILGIWGEDDQSVKADTVRTFEQALKSQGTPTEFHYYAGAGHAFANPTRGDAYKPEATADAWTKTLDFLARNLKK